MHQTSTTTEGTHHSSSVVLSGPVLHAVVPAVSAQFMFFKTVSSTVNELASSIEAIFDEGHRLGRDPSAPTNHGLLKGATYGACRECRSHYFQPFKPVVCEFSFFLVVLTGIQRFSWF